ncbi:MAG: alpha/beta hydrolase domain-containing protein [Vicinamibacterales bacterium]
MGTQTARRTLQRTLICALTLTGLGAPLAGAPAISNPAVSRPVTTEGSGRPFGALLAKDLPPGYVEEERFFSGTATSYARAGEWTTDGRWGVTPATSAAYTVRMLVRRPHEASRFNGIVVMEWLNVSGQREGAADYPMMEDELVRGGYAWIGVGAQVGGVNGPVGLKATDTVRYASLVHPGDPFSFDIFAQAAQAIRHPKGVNPLEGLRVRTMIAAGRSQSAFRLVTFINALHPRARVFDAYFLHSRGGNASGLSADSLAKINEQTPTGAQIRTDIDVPVFDLQTEGDMVALRSHVTRQPASARYRRWEIAGGAHAETPRWIVETPPALDRGPNCKEAVNAVPHHAFVKAGLVALTRWVRDGVAPRQSPEIELTDVAAEDPIARDRHGNAKGGIRTPEIEVPTARLDGRINEAVNTTPGMPNSCFLYGHTVPFDAAALKALYPSREAFADPFTRAVRSLEADGYWLKPDAEAALRALGASRIGH